MTTEKISNDRLWHTPIKAYSDYLGAIEQHGPDNVAKRNEFQKVRETRALAVLCFAMYKQMGTPWYLQLDKSEVTDGRVARFQGGTIEKLNVEITTYMRRPNGVMPTDSLLDQLKKTKTFATHHKYGEHDLVLVDLGSDMGVNFEEIVAYLRSIKAPYQLWTIEQVEPESPDTIAQITFCTTHIGQLRLNVGEAWHEQYEQGVRGVFVAQRTGDPGKAGIQPRDEPITRLVWELED